MASGLSLFAVLLTPAAVPAPPVSAPLALPAQTRSFSYGAPSLAESLPVPVPVPLALSPVWAAPASAERRDSIRAFVLDLDGNAFGPGFPTKIILFEKGTGRELPVSTAQFAVLEKYVGRDVVFEGRSLKDYELRGDASFREFFGPKFAADLRYAVENLPASEWQGPSWPALVRALGDPLVAPYVYVLTARQHSSEQLLDGFRYLQSIGLIKYLPKAENLHGVGGTRRTAERKAELMAEFLDALQAAPSGPGGGPHTIGFSDDTWANYEKMRGALTEIMRREPGRWSKVRISLFFTGRGDPEHAPETVVLG